MDLSLNVQIPESLRQALELAGYSAESLGVEARRALAASLYARRVLTLAQAAHLCRRASETLALPARATLGTRASRPPCQPREKNLPL